MRVAPTIGRTTVEQAHSGFGTLHRAFSAFVFDDAGWLMLQRRAQTKSRFAGLWSNTCCSHLEAAAVVDRCTADRIWDELGLSVGDLALCGAVVCRAIGPGSRYVEHEYDHVLVGRALGDPAYPDPAEVADWRWIEPEVLAAAPDRFTPWLPLTLPLALRCARRASRI